VVEEGSIGERCRNRPQIKGPAYQQGEVEISQRKENQFRLGAPSGVRKQVGAYTLEWKANIGVENLRGRKDRKHLNHVERKQGTFHRLLARQNKQEETQSASYFLKSNICDASCLSGTPPRRKNEEWLSERATKRKIIGGSTLTNEQD